MKSLAAGASIVFSIALLSLSLSSENVSSQPVCSDTDGGRNLFVQGTCSFFRLNLTDRCFAGRFLLERFCVSGRFCSASIADCNKACKSLEAGATGVCAAGACACSSPIKEGRQEIVISEVRYKGNAAAEFVELHVQGDGNKGVDVTNWSISDFDGNNATLPNITGLDDFDNIAIFAGNGINDLNASDGNASVYLSRGSAMLNDIGDEVGLFDSNGKLVDFVRFDGGNGDPVLGGWNANDNGPSSPAGKSVQLHGKDLNSSSNWIAAPPSPASPNIFEFIMPAGRGVRVQIHNGLAENEGISPQAIFRGINYPNFKARGIKFDVRNASPMANLSELKVIEEFLNFSWNFYENKGFNEPEFDGDGDLDVEITTNGDYGAATGLDGIKIDIGNSSISGTIYGVFVKWNIEHEHFHSIQLKLIDNDGKNNSAGDFVRLHLPGFGILNDGPAEYWGLEITKKEFNLSTTTIWNISDFIRNTTAGFTSIPYTLGELTRTLDTNVTNLPTGELEVYYKGYLFARYIAETFNESKLVHIHNITRFNISGGGGNVQGEQAIEKALRDQGINLTFLEVYRNWTVWVYRNFNQSLGYTMDKAFNGSVINETDNLTTWGTDYERVRNASAGFEIIFSGKAGENYSITVLKIANGSAVREDFAANGSTIIRVVPGFSEVVIIKTRIGGNGVVPYNVVIRPLEPRGPKFILDGVSSIFNLTNGTAEIRVDVISALLNNTIHDLEIFFGDQTPLVLSGAIDSLPAGWAGQVFGDGIRLFTIDKPLQTGKPQTFRLRLNATPNFIVIHVTNKTHSNIGSIASQRIGRLGNDTVICRDGAQFQNDIPITIDTEIICMELTGIQPVEGVAKLKNSSANGQLLPGQSFFDVFFDVEAHLPDGAFNIAPNRTIGCVGHTPLFGGEESHGGAGGGVLIEGGDFLVESFFDVFFEVAVSNPLNQTQSFSSSSGVFDITNPLEENGMLCVPDGEDGDIIVI